MASPSAKQLSNSELLRTRIALFSSALDEAAYQFWMHPEFVAVYGEYLFQSHSIIRASVPLMKATLECCRAPKYLSDPVLKPFADYLERHANPTEEDIRVALSGNLCRCTGYAEIVNAALEVASEIQARQPPGSRR